MIVIAIIVRLEYIAYFCIRLLLCVFHGIRIKFTGYTAQPVIGRAAFFCSNLIFAEIFVSNEEKVLYLQCNKEQTRRAAQLYNHCTEIMTTLKDLIGKTIVGYRYGEAPKDGRSYNYRDKNY